MSIRPTIVSSVVEGEGEGEALPKLVQRIAKEFAVQPLVTPRPMRMPRSKLVSPG